MELYGKSSNKIYKTNNFTVKDILMLGIQIIQQLLLFHKNGIIHLDIKPDNFVYDENNNKLNILLRS